MKDIRHCPACETCQPHRVEIQQIIHTTPRGSINKTLEITTCEKCKNTYSKRLEPVAK